MTREREREGRRGRARVKHTGTHTHTLVSYGEWLPYSYWFLISQCGELYFPKMATKILQSHMLIQNLAHQKMV